MRYEYVTVRSFKDPDMAGLPRDNRQRGKWFVHGITGNQADLLEITEKKSEAVKMARKEAKSGGDGETTLVVKNLEGGISEEKTYFETSTRMSP